MFLRSEESEAGFSKRVLIQNFFEQTPTDGSNSAERMRMEPRESKDDREIVKRRNGINERVSKR